MFGIGTTELFIILVIVLILFGGGKLPQLGQSLGKGIRNFRKAISGDDGKDKPEPPASDASGPG